MGGSTGSTALASSSSGVSATTQAILGVAGLSLLVFAAWFASLVLRALLALLPRRAKPAAKASVPAAAPSAAPAAAASTVQRRPDLKTLIRESKAAAKSSHTKEDARAHHALFLTSLKGHGDAINGDPKFRWIRTPQPALACGFGNNPGEVVAVLRDIPEMARLVQYAPTKGAGGGGAVTFAQQWEVPRALDRDPLLEAVIVPGAQSSTGGFAALLSPKRFGRVYSLAGGRQLGAFEPNSLENHALAVSPGGRFLAVASFTSDVKARPLAFLSLGVCFEHVWEIEWGRDGFKGLARAMDLKGHSRKVMCAAISPDGTRAATASEDGTLRVWKLDVRYALQEDPKTLLTVPLESLGLKEGRAFEKMAWGPDGTIAAVSGGHIHFVVASSGRLLETLHAHDGRVACVAWAPALLDVGGGERRAVLASCSGDGRARIWRSPRGES
ncbi:hypothetical protein Rsub_10486 [Raphidocelis subcapitata]|uniref:Uncharacterized protein n=1 Tax=Raphidocelis subcapitata TaxID=307507 RepID=A0A2V0PEY9_9CHLO|nr:hypothetical protein Rsub_10486 [Raphidocelis subcapitata]|eukprot:GBF98421.1 hypothetical protein Rsub_10486 [Raphidocelis subcapitata]